MCKSYLLLIFRPAIHSRSFKSSMFFLSGTQFLSLSGGFSFFFFFMHFFPSDSSSSFPLSFFSFLGQPFSFPLFLHLFLTHCNHLSLLPFLLSSLLFFNLLILLSLFHYFLSVVSSPFFFILSLHLFCIFNISFHFFLLPSSSPIFILSSIFHCIFRLPFSFFFTCQLSFL